jgi:hypothetical protein
MTLSWNDTGSCELDNFRPGACEAKLKELALDGEEASLRGHLKGDVGKEQTGSQSYIPRDAKDDKALAMAVDLLRGTKVNPAFPPRVKNASILN